MFLLGVSPLHAEELHRVWSTPFTERLVNQEVSVDPLARKPLVPVVKEPDAGGAALWYGTVLHRVGTDLNRDARMNAFAVQYDGPRATRVWYDANGNGDLTDDPEPRLYAHSSSTDARSFFVDLAWVRAREGTDYPVSRRVRVLLDPADSSAAPSYRTQNVFGRTGRVVLGGRAHLAMLMDGNADGLYTEDFADGIFVDLDDDRQLSIDQMSPEFGPFAVPFEMEGRSYRCRPLDPRGDVLEWTDLGPAPLRTEVVPGAEAPDFAFPDSAGHPRRLIEWRGRWVVLSFWASWCSACVHQAPALRELFERWHGEGLEMVGISFDEDVNAARAFRKQAGQTWPTRISGRRYWEEPVGRLYQAGGAGLLFLVDPSGRVYGRYTDVPELAQTVEFAMSGTLHVGAADR